MPSDLSEEEPEVSRTVERLRKAHEEGTFEKMALETTQKRTDWFLRNKDSLELQGSDVRKAYTLLLIRYLGIDPTEVPVVYEDGTKIVWRSTNSCPLLEACKRLGLDTRTVCKSQELPVQEFISMVNPNLRFSRNYDRIRPHASYCEETIELK